jgi:hypothetical protein
MDWVLMTPTASGWPDGCADLLPPFSCAGPTLSSREPADQVAAVLGKEAQPPLVLQSNTCSDEGGHHEPTENTKFATRTKPRDCPRDNGVLYSNWDPCHWWSLRTWPVAPGGGGGGGSRNSICCEIGCWCWQGG